MQTCWRKGIQMWVDGNPGSAGTRPSLRLMSLFYIDSVLAVLGLHRCGRDWGVGGGGAALFAAMLGLLLAVASLVSENGL